MNKYIVLQFSGSVAHMVTAQPPEITSVYDTYRYGELQYFTVCDGSVGDAVFYTDFRGRRAEYEVVINDITYGSPEVPDQYLFVARFKGYV